ncbi:unnamed protein product (mitochondrion) [Plasmodiophora brassicae]|uniref:Uncharacterized protein n=1 Tax=Plasmodiophora brassicae TaxID=37360 RepID=A0A3P3Y9U7_PLABS|nr:unnamed protein product [Plasmodiophora brassicae]
MLADVFNANFLLKDLMWMTRPYGSSSRSTHSQPSAMTSTLLLCTRRVRPFKETLMILSPTTAGAICITIGDIINNRRFCNTIERSVTCSSSNMVMILPILRECETSFRRVRDKSHYTTAFPASPNIATAAGQAAGVGAAPVAVGAPMQAQDILDADNEAQARKRHRLAHPAQITGDECAASMVRSHAIIAEHAAQAYAGVGAPAWFAPALQAQLQPQLQTLQAQLDQALQAHLQLLSARTDNLRIRSRNVHRITIQQHLSPVGKEVAGHPAGAIPAVFAVRAAPSLWGPSSRSCRFSRPPALHRPTFMA